MANSPRSPMSGINSTFATLLALIAIASVIPVASARPSWWLLWSAVLAALCLVWLYQSRRLTPTRQMQIHELRYYIGFAALVPLYALLQTLPLPFLPLAMNDGAEALSGTTISVLPSASQIGAIRFAAWIILFILVYEVTTSRERMVRINWILFIGITLQAIWALLALRVLGDIALFGEKTTYFGSATGTFINRNSLATFLGFGLVIGTGLLARRMGKPTMRQSRLPNIFEQIGADGIFILCSMVMILVALIATQSRLGLSASLIALWVSALLLLKQIDKLTRSAIWTSIGLAVLIILAVLISGQGGVSERLLFLERSGNERLEIYRQTLEMIARRPFFGFGFDAYGTAFEGFRTSALNQPYFYDLAHNSYLTFWAEQGLIIGSIPMILLAIAGWKIIQGLRADDGFPAAKIVGLGALLLGAIHSLGDFSLEIPANTFVFIILIAMALARRGQQKRSTRTTDSQ